MSCAIIIKEVICVKAKQFLFVGTVLLISICCLAVMNINYDRLSRYPYQDETARKIINETFSDQDIAYLIEYSIAPSEFIDYALCPGFSIYHAADYNQVRSSVWYLDAQGIVQIVEAARDYVSMDELIHLLNAYDGVTILNYFSLHPDNDSQLVLNPGEITAVVDDSHTVYTRILFDAMPVVSLISKEDQVSVSSALIDPVKSMCIAIESELDNRKTCGGLIADAGYLTYDEQSVLFESMKETYGDDVLLYTAAHGHSEHQLGYAIDFSVSETEQKEFKNTVQYEWLKENAHRFGFVQSYQKEKEEQNGKLERPWHWRYVGYEMAAKMHYENLTLKEALQ